MTYPCEKGPLIDLIRENITEIKQDQKEIRADIKEILAFKFQILGGVILGSVVMGFVFNLVMYEITKK